MINEEQARALVEQVLGFCDSQPAELAIYAERKALTRFASNAIHQNVSEDNARMQVRLAEGRRAGAATTNRLDRAGLEAAVESARAVARASPEESQPLRLAEPCEYPTVAAYDPDTAAQSPRERAAAIAQVCKRSAAAGTQAYGAYSSGEEVAVVANSNGLFGYQRTTLADFQTVVMGIDSSGWSQASDWRAGNLPIETLGEEAVAKALATADPRPIEPGVYPVVLDPYATQDLIGMLNTNGMGARAFLDGRSWMHDRIGTQALDAQISIRDEPLKLDFSPMAFDFEGTPKQELAIVDKGVIVGPVYDRATADQAGVASTGHALPPFVESWARALGPLARHLVVPGGDQTTQDLIGGLQEGLYITRFWYTRLVHPRDCVVTGMTRDGVLKIERGELAYPVKNLRFTQAYVEALAQVEAVGSDQRTLSAREGYYTARVPALRIAGFRFTGSTV